MGVLHPTTNTRSSVAGRYQLQASLSAHDGAALYRAWDTQANTHVTVRLRPDGPGPDVPEHQNLVRVLARGWHGTRAYVVTEWSTGTPLPRLLGPPWNPESVVRLMGQCCAALGALHMRGLHHGNLTSDAVVLEADGMVKVLGGLAIDGTVPLDGRYLAPERWGGGPPSVAADLYALGVLGFELLTGTHPFARAAEDQLGWLHLLQPVPPPSTLRAGLPLELDRIILRLLRKDPAARFPGCHALTHALDGVLERWMPNAA